jgi:trimeric autotransporter adhesin
VNLTNLTATGTVQGASLTDGTATMSGGNLSGVGTLTATTVNTTNLNLANVTATGTVQGGSITDNTATMSGGNISGVNTLTAANGNIANLVVGGGGMSSRSGLQ